MILASVVSTKFANPSKLVSLDEFINEYRNLMACYIDVIWELDKVPKYCSKEITSQPTTWLSARLRQSACAQASGVVRGTRAEQEKRKYMIEKLRGRGEIAKAEKLESIYARSAISKPKLHNVQPVLDSRFVEIDLSNDTSFDGFLVLSSIGNKMKLKIPFKRTKHFNKLMATGKLKPGVRISKKAITFSFEMTDVEPQSGSTVGIDVGKTNVLSCSNGHMSKKNKHGHDFDSILPRLARKKKGSKGFAREQSHRTNYTNWSVNQMNLDGVSQVNLENIKHLRRGKRVSGQMSYWTYTSIFDKLIRYCAEHGVRVQRVEAAYTSQRCQCCGFVCKRNRKGKKFKCVSCGFAADADLNAAKNIALDLPKFVGKANADGCFWHPPDRHL